MRRLRKQGVVCRKSRSVVGDELPLVLITDILSRLSIKDVVTCRCVCKSWDDIITKDPHFIHLHWSRLTAHHPSSVLLHDVNSPRATSDFFLVSKPDNNTQEWKKTKISTAESIAGRIVASCNGMLCIESSSKNLITIYNPFSKDRLVLPELHFKHNSDILCYRYGFGFDGTNKKYKVIVAVSMRYYVYDGGFLEIRTKIINLGEDRWRDIQFPSEVKLHDIKPYFSNGFFYWIPSPCFNNRMITALDVSTEKFHTINLSSIPANLPSSSYLTQIDNSFGIFCDANCPGYFSVKLETWSLMYVLGRYFYIILETWNLMDANTNSDSCFFYQNNKLSINIKRERCVERCINIRKTKFRLLGVIGSGDFMLMASDGSEGGENGRNHLLFYDSDRNEASFLDLAGVPSFFDAILFVPSLISPSTL